MKYYYLGKETAWDRTHYPIPTAPFKAVRVKNPQTSEMTFVPIVQTEWEKKHEEFFYYGFGRIKTKGRKTYEIPLYDGDPAKWREYIEKYGKECLYYSINGKAITGDCCDLNEIYEFYSICHSDAVKYPAYVDSYIKMNEIQERVISEKFGENGILKSERNGLFFRPCHTIMGFAFPYSANVIADDKKLENFWRSYRKKDIPFPQRYDRNFVEQIEREIDTENDVFPTCMSDRIKMIYGEECERIYDSILKLCA